MYIFESTISFQEKERNCLIVFSGQLDFKDSDFTKQIENEFQKYQNSPDEVFFILPSYLEDELALEIEEKNDFFSSITRYEDTPVTALLFDVNSNLKRVKIKGKSFLSGRSSIVRDQIVNQGILNLVSKNKEQIILKAPSGTVFMKPSKQIFDEFISTGGLAIGSSEHQFVAFSLLSKIENPSNIKNIYIDSSRISAIAEALINYLYRFSGKVCRSVSYHSFSSYDGKDKNKPDSIENIFVIISASRSNNLGKEIAKQWNLNHRQIVTILSYRDKENNEIGDEILANISHLSESCLKEAETGSLVKVEVVGENFTSEIKAPHPVMIKAIHKPKVVDNWVSKNNSNKLFSCNLRKKGSLTTPHITINSEYDISNDKNFKNWLERICKWYLPFNIKWIIVPTIEGNISKLIDELKFILEKLKISDYEILSTDYIKEKISGDGAAIVLNHILDSGDFYLKVNRLLRIAGHEGNRVFINSFSLFHSKEDYDKAQKSTLYGPDGLKYQSHTYKSAFIGGLHNKTSWELELSVSEQLVGSFWETRSNQLRSLSEGLNGFLGLHSENACEKLEFTSDFAFWPKEYDPEKIDPEAVYMTISLILQSLREKRFTDIDQDSLYSNVYFHSVLDPENFERFNDSLLQSCLWRTANHRELDYASSDKLSNTFCNIVEGLAERAAAGHKNAYLDLLMGIATQKIKVSNESLNQLIEKISYIELPKHSKRLITFIEEVILGLRHDHTIEVPF